MILFTVLDNYFILAFHWALSDNVMCVGNEPIGLQFCNFFLQLQPEEHGLLHE